MAMIVFSLPFLVMTLFAGGFLLYAYVSWGGGQGRGGQWVHLPYLQTQPAPYVVHRRVSGIGKAVTLDMHHACLLARLLHAKNECPLLLCSLSPP